MSTTIPSNLTNSSTRENAGNAMDYWAIYIACELVGVCSIVITLYVLICLVTFGIKTKKFSFSGRKSDINGGMVFVSATTAVALTIPRYVSSQVIFNVLNIEDATQWCEVLLDVANACYFVSGYSIYIFLWVRQKALYSHPAIKKLAGKCIQVFSWITLIVLSAAALAVLLWFVIPDDFTYNDTGCVVNSFNVSGAEDVSYQVYYLVLVGLLLLAQVSLLILFIYPMVRTNAIQNVHRFSRQCSGIDVTEAAKDDQSRRASKIESFIFAIRNATRKLSTSSNGKSNTVQKTIRRSVACAAIAMVSDIAAMVLASFALSPDLPRTVNNTVYDIGLLISVLCILATFTSYRRILNVFCRSAANEPLDKTSMSADESRRYNEKSRSQEMDVSKVDEAKRSARTKYPK